MKLSDKTFLISYGIFFALLGLIFLFSGCQQAAAEGTEVNTASTGDSKWHLIGTVGEPAFLSTWTNFSATAPCAFRKDGQGFVHLKGVATGGSSASTIYYLPAGYRPGNYQYFGNSSVYINVGTNGAVSGSAAFVYLDGLSFLAEQ